MKAVILAGGMGTRISEESHIRPKPMIEIGDKPILWHILKIYSSYGINDFIICCGYKGYVIKEYFANYFLHNSDVTFNLKDNQMNIHHNKSEPWRITLADTGPDTMTGGRLKRVKPYLDEQDFCFTYGDGVADIDIQALIHFHQQHKKLATVTAVAPQERFGILDIENHGVQRFIEKPVTDAVWINGGFFVLNPKVIDLIDDDSCIWEKKPLETLAQQGQLMAYKHTGFWQPMDTLRDKTKLEELYKQNKAPWKTWR